MEFTYAGYRRLLNTIRTNNYNVCGFTNWLDYKRSCILRHDIDNDIDKAICLAEIEAEEGFTSNFFVLVTSDFYNVFSARNEKLLRKISELGHEIGLHFDEVRYPEINTPEDVRDKILKESKLLEMAVGKAIKTVSMHRPSKMILQANLQIPGMVNSYSQTFFKEFKYVSDSRKRWREPVEAIIKSGEFDRIQILTHAIWYNESEKNIHDSIYNFVNAGNRQRYQTEMENITDLESIMSSSEVR